jgi:uncharacterized surface protein with fasciclin (FAS1) repeats
MISDAPQVTLFVPVDSAWAALARDSETTVDALRADNTTLAHVALYHVLPEAVPADQLGSRPFWQPYWSGHYLFGESVSSVGSCTAVEYALTFPAA